MASKSRRRATHLVNQDRQLRFELIRLREASGLTQRDVAERIGVTPQAISKFERIDADPKLSTIRRYAHAIEAIVSHKVEKDEGQLADGVEWTVFTVAVERVPSTPAPTVPLVLLDAETRRTEPVGLGE
jgi:transcriptional regulator with XRE-family HTH domain